MRRRQVDPRPPVEVLGSEADDRTLQRVEVGAGKRSRGKGLLLGVAAVAVLIAGLSLGGPDDGPRVPSLAGERDGSEQAAKRRATATTRPPRTTTTPPAPVAVIPGSDTQVLLLRGGRGGELLDLGTGETIGVDIGRNVYSAVPVQGGVVVVESRVGRYRKLPFGQPVDLGPADEVFSSGDPSSAWLVRHAEPGQGPLSAVKVDLAGRPLSDQLGVDQGWIVGASRSGLVVQAGGRLYELRADGAIRVITSGEAMGMSAGRLIARVCDDRATCGLRVWDVDLRSSIPIDVPEALRRSYGAGVTVQPGGTQAVLQSYGPSSSNLVLIDLDGGPPQELDAVLNLGVTSVAWLPGDLDLLVVKPHDLVRVHRRGDKILVEDVRGRGADMAVVIPR